MPDRDRYFQGEPGCCDSTIAAFCRAKTTRRSTDRATRRFVCWDRRASVQAGGLASGVDHPQLRPNQGRTARVPHAATVRERTSPVRKRCQSAETRDTSPTMSPCAPCGQAPGRSPFEVAPDVGMGRRSAQVDRVRSGACPMGRVVRRTSQSSARVPSCVEVCPLLINETTRTGHCRRPSLHVDLPWPSCRPTRRARYAKMPAACSSYNELAASATAPPRISSTSRNCTPDTCPLRPTCCTALLPGGTHPPALWSGA